MPALPNLPTPLQERVLDAPIKPVLVPVVSSGEPQIAQKAVLHLKELNRLVEQSTKLNQTYFSYLRDRDERLALREQERQREAARMKKTMGMENTPQTFIINKNAKSGGLLGGLLGDLGSGVGPLLTGLLGLKFLKSLKSGFSKMSLKVKSFRVGGWLKSFVPNIGSSLKGLVAGISSFKISTWLKSLAPKNVKLFGGALSKIVSGMVGFSFVKWFTNPKNLKLLVKGKHLGVVAALTAVLGTIIANLLGFDPIEWIKNLFMGKKSDGKTDASLSDYAIPALAAGAVPAAIAAKRKLATETIKKQTVPPKVRPSPKPKPKAAPIVSDAQTKNRIQKQAEAMKKATSVKTPKTTPKPKPVSPKTRKGTIPGLVVGLGLNALNSYVNEEKSTPEIVEKEGLMSGKSGLNIGTRLFNSGMEYGFYGSLGGGLAGGALGSVVPGAGTLAGAGVGSTVGFTIGAGAGVAKEAAQILYDLYGEAAKENAKKLNDEINRMTLPYANEYGKKIKQMAKILMPNSKLDTGRSFFGDMMDIPIPKPPKPLDLPNKPKLLKPPKISNINVPSIDVSDQSKIPEIKSSSPSFSNMLGSNIAIPKSSFQPNITSASKLDTGRSFFGDMMDIPIPKSTPKQPRKIDTGRSFFGDMMDIPTSPSADIYKQIEKPQPSISKIDTGSSFFDMMHISTINTPSSDIYKEPKIDTGRSFFGDMMDIPTSPQTKVIQQDSMWGKFKRWFGFMDTQNKAQEEKAKKIRQRYEAMRKNILPNAIELDVNPENMKLQDQFLSNIQELERSMVLQNKTTALKVITNKPVKIDVNQSVNNSRQGVQVNSPATPKPKLDNVGKTKPDILKKRDAVQNNSMMGINSANMFMGGA